MNITVEELKAKLNEVKLVDVREADEFFEHIEGAENKPLGALFRDFSKGVFQLPSDKEIVCYCLSGVRGSLATEFLKSKGLNVKNLEGGFLAWKSNK